jgi:hypothetical protein
MNNGSSQSDQTSSNFALTTGQTYYFQVTSSGTSSYSVQVNNPAANPNQTNCATAQILCSGGSYSGAANLWGTQELTNSTLYGCNLSKEINSNWYVLNVLTGGTLTFTLSPTDGVDDYDYALYSSNDCNSLGAPVSCSYSSVLGVTGISSASGGTSNNTGSGGITWNKDYTVSAGVYLLYINGFTPASEGYSFTLGGTAILGCTYPTLLPVELLSFGAKLNGKQVDINWSTSTELNNGYFTIEKSKDAIHFEELTKVKGHGTTTTRSDYATVDHFPYSGVSYYKLSQTDFNGNKKEYTITTINNVNDDGMFTIAPNPTSDGAINVSYHCDASTTGVLSIFDCNGMLVLSKEVQCTSGNNASQLNMSDNAKGIYFVTFSTNDKFYRTKLIKN